MQKGGFVVVIPPAATAFILPIEAHPLVWEDLCGEYAQYISGEIEALVPDEVSEYNERGIRFLSQYNFQGWKSRALYQTVLIVHRGPNPLTWEQALEIKKAVYT